MENPSRLEENFKVVTFEMVALERLIDEVARRGEKGKERWLKNIEDIRNEVDNMRKDLNDLKEGPSPNSWNARLNLNKKVIHILKGVKLLQEEGYANSESVELFLSGLATDNTKRFSPGDLMSFTSNFSTQIGAGACGIVYKGQFPDGMSIAVKVLRENDVIEEMFMAEVSAMGRIRHRYLVKLYGFCFHTNMIAVVYEYMENGSLDKILYENHLGMDWEKLYDIAIKIGKGLSYLHDGCDQQIIHHDVKAGNVLLDSDFGPKVSDFGLAKLMNKDASHFTLSRTRGTPGYAAPEMWIPSSPVTYKCDVYSFGMLLFEILARRRNKQGKKWFPKLVWEKFETGQLDEILKDCGIREESREKATTLSMVALWCAQFTPSARPSMSTVVKLLDKEMSIMMPPNPFIPSSESLVPPTLEVVYSRASPAISEVAEDQFEGTILSEGKQSATRLAYQVSEKEDSDSSEYGTSSEVDLLPAVNDLQIAGECFPGKEVTTCGYSDNGTTSCNFRWVRYLEDGSFVDIDGATTPSYLVSADDVDTYLAVEVEPLDDRNRKGEVVKVFANDQRKIRCAPDMQEYIEKTLYSGCASFEVTVALKYLDIWDPAILSIKREGYKIKCTSNRGVVAAEMFLKTSKVTIPYGHPNEFHLHGSAVHLLRAESSSSRDEIVLTFRLFMVRSLEKSTLGRKKSLLWW